MRHLLAVIAISKEQNTCKKDLDFWDILDINLQSGLCLEGHPASPQCQDELEECGDFAVNPHLKPDSVLHVKPIWHQ
ncbi:hypothetical protein AV530_015323 [Patagioenas fasciata monilis]|uniref:Uncharacterized protein n=1 Tax=Patagioenas fasciata monilis TaxID=372326 RepID=A0A1V4K1P2_PATFA|nr:hypothetical protein AV530_015323 [Patagioenas fasciata monilis]